MYSDPDKDTINQYTKRMEFLKGFLNTKEIVIYHSTFLHLRILNTKFKLLHNYVRKIQKRN